MSQAVSQTRFRVFIENEAGSTIKNHHDEKALKLLFIEEVSRPYPYPYGFVLNTTSGDGDNVDCFVLTDRALATGETLEVVPVGFLEQYVSEPGSESHEVDHQVDHNVLAVPVGEEPTLDPSVEPKLQEFIAHVFDHVEDKTLSTGELLGPQAAIDFVNASLDQSEST